MQLEHLGEVLVVPTIEPRSVIPFSTVSKIGIGVSFSCGNPTNTSVPPGASDA